MGNFHRRECGTCSACCIHLELEGRPAHTRCPELTRDGHCGIYDNRPRTCGLFSCLWKIGQLDRHLRPDKCGVLAHIVLNRKGGIGINVIECRGGALGQCQQLVNRCKELPCRLVQFFYLNGRRVLYSKDKVWIDALREDNPLISLPDEITSIEIVGHEDGNQEHNEGPDGEV